MMGAPTSRDCSPRLSGRSEAEVFAACYAPERKRPFETGQQSWPEFVRAASKRLGLRLSDGHFKDVFDSGHFAPNAAIFDVVERVSSRYRIAVCSNTGPTHWELQRSRLPLFEKFDPVILSFEVGAMKPSREIFDALAKTSGVPHNRIVFIDDSAVNVEGARRAGLCAIQYVGVKQLEADLRVAGVGAEARL